jgi:hypothetical protein
MIKIAFSQMEHFELLSRKEFESRVATHLRKHLGEECVRYDDDMLRGWISESVAGAEQVQIRKERNMVAYMDIMMWLEGDPARQLKTPLVQQILNDPLIDSEDDRIQILLGYVLDETQ